MCVVPSLPGCGYSERPATLMTRTRTATLSAKLMTEVLGYRRFVARGADIGATITSLLGLDHAEHVAAIHLSDVPRPYLGPGAAPLTAAEERFLAEEAEWIGTEGAYDSIQATKPRRSATGSNDYPGRPGGVGRGEVPLLERLRRQRGTALHQG